MGSPQKDRTKRKPTSRDWDLITVKSLEGLNPREIKELYPHLQIEEQSIRNKMSSMGVYKKRQAINQKFVDSVASSLEARAKLVSDDCFTMFDELSKTIHGLISEMNEELATGEYKKGKARATAYNVNLMSQAITTTHNGKYKCLGVDPNGVLEQKELEPQVLVIENLDEKKI